MTRQASPVDGGPAFPVMGARWDSHSGFHDVKFDGMALRDYFAAKAMQGMCAHGASVHTADELIAQFAYSVADAMLARRATLTGDKA